MNGRGPRCAWERVAAFLDLEISAQQTEQMLAYAGLLIEGLKRQRLVGESSGEALIEKQFCDALFPLKLMGFMPGSMLDLGTGGGLPGIPLKICLPQMKLYLVDANRRKINFLQRVAAELNLDEVHFMPDRAERWGRHPRYRERFDYVVSRAVARASVLAELALPLVRRGGTLIMYKGKQGLPEMAAAAVSIDLCGGRLEHHWRYRLPTGEGRTLFSIRKERATPELYPRRTGKPAKSPLGS